MNAEREVDRAKNASEVAAAYDLLLHSLAHTHTQGYVDRHVLLFDKWCRDYSDGLYIRDLNYVIEIIRIFRERHREYPSLFRKTFSSILRLFSRPLLECKANERRSKAALENIAELYREIVLLFSCGDARLKVEVVRCLRCIVLAGKDPMVLRADQIEWTPDGNRLQVVDAAFIQSIMRDSGALAVVVQEFLHSVDTYQSGLKDYNRLLSQSAAKEQTSKTRGGDQKPASQRKSQEEDDDSSAVSLNKSPSRTSASAAASAAAGGGAKAGDALDGDGDGDNTSFLENLKVEVSGALTLAYSLLDLCMDFAAFDRSAAIMCRFGVCDGAIKLLQIGAASESGHEGSDSKMPQAVDLMWTVLECYLTQAKAENSLKEYTCVDVLNFEVAIKVLLDLFLKLLRDGYRLSDKECRNEVAIVLTLIINFPAASPFFVQSGVLITFVTYACVAEAGRRAWPFFPRPLAKSRNFANVFDIDIQFKQILWMAISDILDLNDADALLVVAASPLIPTLMSYLEHDSLDPVPRHSSSTVDHNNNNNNTLMNTSNSLLKPSDERANAFIKQLSLSQLRELQVQAIKFLSKNVCKMIGEFARIHGISRMIDITCRYYQSTIQEHKQLIYQSILLLKRCVLCSNVVKHVLAEENAIQTFLFLLEYSDDEATRSSAARLIAIMCSGPNRLCQEQLRSQDGVRALVNALNSYSLSRKPVVGRKSGAMVPSKAEGAVDDPWEDFRSGDVPVLIVSILDCINCSIVGYDKNEVSFANEEGIDKLLELLEVSPFVLRTPVLRLLSDLLENPLLMSVLQAWRSRKTLRSSAQILAHCWLDEECRLDGTREKGVLSNLQNPLGNHSWPVDTRITVINHIDSPTSPGGAISDEPRASLIVSKLAAAIMEGRNVAHGSVPMDTRSQVLEKDIRAILASIFQQIGIFNAENPLSAESNGLSTLHEGDEERDEFDGQIEEGEDDERQDDRSVGSTDTHEPIVSSTGDLRLTPGDHQVLAVAQRYKVLREGEWWREVMSELQRHGIRPIETDFELIERHMEKTFDATVSTQLQQMELQAEDKRLKQREEKGFNDQLITQKNHQIKTEWLKRNRKNKSVASPHTRKMY